VIKTAAGAGLLALASPLILGCDSRAQANSPAGLSLPKAPTAFAQSGRTVLAYELYVKKYVSFGLAAARVDILAETAVGEILKTYEGSELTQCLSVPAAIEDTAVVFIWVTLDPALKIPATLYHRVYFADGTAAEGAATPVTTNAPLVIAPPLAGDRWWAANGPSNFDRHHRSSIFNLNNKTYLGQRFAVDWLRFDATGRLFAGSGDNNSDFFCYGTDLLAVAAGTVVEARDGIPDNSPVGTLPSLTLQNLGGNSIVIDIGGGRFAYYAHVIPGTMTVKIGDSVVQGQVVGKLGNSGNSDAPHLHFHICSGRDYLFSEGLPYTFSTFKVQGTWDFERLGSGDPWTPIGPEVTRTNELFALNQVVRLT
jgi:hypothetical protein